MSVTNYFKIQRKRHRSEEKQLNQPTTLLYSKKTKSQSNQPVVLPVPCSSKSRSDVSIATPPKKSTESPKNTESPKLEKFQLIEFESPRKKSHACRALNLTTEESELPLPHTYKVLEEKFRHIDTIVSMFSRRNEICTYSKLSEAVQEITRRNLTLEDIAKVKYLYPNAYEMKQERHIPGVYNSAMYNSYQLTIAFKDDDKLTASKLVLRRRKFRSRLLEVVMEHHKAFLASMDIVCNNANIHAWHPNFKLEDVPQINEADLPQPPSTESCTTAKQVLEVAGSKSLQRKAQEAPCADADNPEDCQHGLKGVSQDLLQRVRQKQAIKAAAAITVDPATQKRLNMMSRLPELCRILRSLFVTERKATIAWPEVISKLSDSHSSHLSYESTEEHITLLTEVLPSFVKKVMVRSKQYLKVNKNCSLKEIYTHLEQ